jgi:hypothetical protein
VEEVQTSSGTASLDLSSNRRIDSRRVVFATFLLSVPVLVFFRVSSNHHEMCQIPRCRKSDAFFGLTLAQLPSAAPLF